MMERGLSSVLRLGLAASGALFVCSMTTLASPAGVTISHQWLRYVAPGVPVAGYFTLNNNSDKPTSLDGAVSSACGHLALHESMVQNGTARMKMVQSVSVPPHSVVMFQPGGYHLMCMSPASEVRPGHTVAVTLRFQDRSSLISNFPIYGAKGK